MVSHLTYFYHCLVQIQVVEDSSSSTTPEASESGSSKIPKQRGTVPYQVHTVPLHLGQNSHTLFLFFHQMLRKLPEQPNRYSSLNPSNGLELAVFEEEEMFVSFVIWVSTVWRFVMLLCLKLSLQTLSSIKKVHTFCCARLLWVWFYRFSDTASSSIARNTIHSKTTWQKFEPARTRSVCFVHAACPFTLDTVRHSTFLISDLGTNRCHSIRLSEACMLSACEPWLTRICSAE